MAHLAGLISFLYLLPCVSHDVSFYAVAVLYGLLPFMPFQTGEETFFKIKKTTKMSKVFETYANRKGVQSSSLRFLLDGERIEPDSTPKILELDDQDQIDCMLEQSGGGRS